MERLYLDSNILLTMISINMTIIGLTICLSFAIYYFFGFFLRENPAVKRQLYENELIRAGEIESWGRGIQRIIEACQAEGCPTPIFEYRAGGIWTTFHFGEEYMRGVGLHSDSDVVENVVENVVKRPDKIIELLKSDCTLGASHIAKQLGVTSRTIQRDLERLTKDGRIKRVGPDKGGYWEVLDK